MLQTNKIRMLPQEISNKIAAGEVVDRPVSIVKELVENSIDAMADFIVVEIKEGGKTYIRVSDNGFGIEKESIELAFERHATSKISTAEDMDNIRSLGFRGEALASIAAVSHIEIISKTKDEDTGIKMGIVGGQIINKSEIGSSQGTTIIIKDLFFNVPARLKFLKQAGAEANLIIDLLSKIALAYPHIKFRFINNTRTLFVTNGSGDIHKNIRSIYKNELPEDLLMVTGKEGPYKLKAYISKPSSTKSNRKHQIFFVNGRYIHNNIMDKSVNRAYKELLFDNRYPIIFLFLKVDPMWIDVNIHPNKREIKFRDEKTVEEFIYQVLRKALITGNSIPKLLKEEKLFQNPMEKQESKPGSEQVDINKILQTKEDYEKQYQAYYQDPIIERIEKTFEKQAEESYKVPVPKQPFNMLSLKIMGTIFGTYILASDEEYFYFIDQHAAHERVLYERFLEEYYAENVMIQSLLMTEIIELSIANSYKIEMNIEFIKRIGFDLDPFGKNTFIMKGIPYGLEYAQAQSFLFEIIDHLDENTPIESRDKIEHVIAKACKKAIKANDLLDEKEIDALIQSLSKTDNPFSCPHGRPVFIRMSESELERKFKR